MIKINTGKEKTISFDIDIEGGDIGQIKEGRFILTCPNKKYKLMFKAIVENGTVTINLPPLDVNEKTGECTLEMISMDDQYYPVWNDNVKFEHDMKIKIKKQTEIKPVVEIRDESKPNIKKKEIINETKKPIIKSSETRTVYRTIKCDQSTIENIVESGKFSMKPKDGMKIKFYNSDTMLINDLELVEYGICIAMDVPVNGILTENKDHSLIVDSSYLDKINDDNVLFIIKKGTIKSLKDEKKTGL